MPAIAGDELGPRAGASYAGPLLVRHALSSPTIARPQATSPWCDDVTHAGDETCDQAVTRALHDGRRAIWSQRLGADMTRWRWDAVHRAVFPHQGLDSVGFLRPLLSRIGAERGRLEHRQRRAGCRRPPVTSSASIPGYRQIVDLSPANDSRFLDAVGESGHFLSPHYDDFLADWQAVRHKKMRMDRADIDNGAIGTLRLVPR